MVTRSLRLAAIKLIKLWKQDGTIIATLNGHSDKIWQAVFSPDGQTIASASKDKTIKLWRIEAGKIPVLINDPCWTSS
ncbi:MAG UNVERIFIED_CONTAM: hypothetical protein LVR29_05725 [Microcystis novacekii LVE1205-3]